MRAFASSYQQLERILRTGSGGVVPEDTIEPLTDVPSLADVDLDEVALADALAAGRRGQAQRRARHLDGHHRRQERAAGQGRADASSTSSPSGPALRQRVRRRAAAGPHEQFRTSEDSLARPGAATPTSPVEGLPLDFLQNAEPKLRADDLDPGRLAGRPGAGVVPARPRRRLRRAAAHRPARRAAGRAAIRYVFLSNADNLGATCDPRIAAWIVGERRPVRRPRSCERTVNDRKGGHFAAPQGRRPARAARQRDGRARARSTLPGHRRGTRPSTPTTSGSTCASSTRCSTRRGPRQACLGLPIIVNRKTVDPSDAASHRGHPDRDRDGCGDREASRARGRSIVPRDRFRPVKTTNELLLLRSDVFELDERLRARPADRPPGALRRPRRAVTSSSPTSTSASRTGCRRCAEATRCVVDGRRAPSAPTSSVVGDVTVDGGRRPAGRRRHPAAGLTCASVAEHLQAVLAAVAAAAPAPRGAARGRRSGWSSPRTSSPGSTCPASTTRRWTATPCAPPTSPRRPPDTPVDAARRRRDRRRRTARPRARSRRRRCGS